MIELVRNCPGNSTVATYRVWGSNGPKWIWKVSHEKEGLKRLRREMQGWRWYGSRCASRREHPFCVLLIKKPSYMKLRIKCFAGRKGSLRGGLQKNSPLLKRTVLHYCRVWGKERKKYVPAHGDMSLENIIATDKGIHLIDWEYFDAGGGPWGYDVLHLFYETLYLQKGPSAKVTKQDIKIIVGAMKKLHTVFPLEENVLVKPLKSVRQWLLKRNVEWDLKENYRKFPVLSFSEDFVEQLDGWVWEKLRSIV